jgi:hypothetical protein
MQSIDTIPTNCDYFFMREGVRPMWEDAANVGGGELRLTVQKGADAASMWKNALLFAVGSQATDYAIINGIQFAFRPTRNRLSVWTRATTSGILDNLKEEFGAMMQSVTGENAPRIEFFSFSKQGGGHSKGGAPDGSHSGSAANGSRHGSVSSDHHGRGGGSTGGTSFSADRRPRTDAPRPPRPFAESSRFGSGFSKQSPTSTESSVPPRR